ncbi:MAG: ABC transporter permease [Clostridiales bacterium]|nr:ABC transporter permease [Clostridiales bacterium]
MRKAWSVFQRDLKISIKDPMAIWMIIAPILIALVILWIAPGISETTVNFAVDEKLDAAYIQTLSDYASVETLDGADAVNERVMRRDEVIGLTQGKTGPILVRQGNETENTMTIAKVLTAMAVTGATGGEASGSFGFLSFRDETSPLKRALSITLLIMISVITSMLISMGLVDEKNDQTIKAANVTPMKQSVYVLSKSLIGVLALLFTSVITLFILGITDINWVQILIMIFVNAMISIIVAFVIGLASTDYIEAASSVKMLMLPMIASVLVYELTDPVWHITVWWSPFYWAYRGITEIILGTAQWGSTLLYAGIIIVISVVVFSLCLKRIRKSLQ